MRLQEDHAMLDRLYTRLTAALSERPDPFGAPITVAELYQELVPYRAVRGDVGFAMNADYEHTLLRLLSGEGEFARLEPTGARDEILRELRSPNPNVSVYREYAACEVWITPPPEAAPALGDDEDLQFLQSLGADIDDDPGDEVIGFGVLELTEDDEIEAQSENGGYGADTGAPAEPYGMEHEMPAESAPESAGVTETGEAASAAATEPAAERRETDGRSSAAEAAARYAAAQQAAVSAAGSGGSCVFCDSRLPAGRKARYCPFCGGDQTMRPCPTCGEALEAGWVFCIACGAPAQGDDV
jgi:hypothetical protein